MARFGRSFPIRPKRTRASSTITVTIALTTPNVTLAVPALAVTISVNIALTTPNISTAVPSLTLTAGVNLTLTTPNVTLGVPDLLVNGGAGVTITLSTPSAAVQAPSLSITIIPPHIFRPPWIKLRPADSQGERLWLYYGTNQGISLLKNHDGTYTQVRFPTTDQINAAAFTYMGGHEYVVDDAEYAALVAAGYLAGFTDPLDTGGYGTGFWGGNSYGN